MKSPDPWPSIHEERRALAADVQSLTDAQWSTPSLCVHWSVRDVLGHMIATAQLTPATFFLAFVRSRCRFDAMTAKGVAAQVEGTPRDTLNRFNSVLVSTTHPPGPIEAMLGETIIHAEDIRRPLGMTRVYPPQTLIRVVDFYKKSNLLIGGKRRVAGLTLRASDVDWSCGSGPEVTGPMVSLALAICGRSVALLDLSGEGLPTLQDRMQH